MHQPVPRGRAMRAALLVPLLSLGSTALAQGTAVSVCAERNPATKKMTVIVSNGCVSSSYGYRGHNITVDVKQETASITVAGNFSYAPPRNAAGTTDCANAKTLHFDAPGTDPRRYSVVHDGRYIGVIDLSATNARSCAREDASSLDQIRNKAENLPPDRRFIPVDLKSWEPRQAASLMELFAPIFRNHPESLEGRPSIRLAANEERAGKGMIVEIEVLGYLDDAVAGEQFLGLVQRGENSWMLHSLWKRGLCRRGPYAGQWTGKPCT